MSPSAPYPWFEPRILRIAGIGRILGCLLLLPPLGPVTPAAPPAIAIRSKPVDDASAPDGAPGPDAASAPTGPDKDPAQRPAGRITVSGLGWLENLSMKGVLRQLRPGGKAPPAYDANFIEDGAFVLLNRAQRLGFIRARVTCDVTLADGGKLRATWTGTGDAPLPRLLAATAVRYEVHPGRRHYYESLEFNGLSALTDTAARGYFVRTDGLLRTRALRRYSPAEFDEATANLRSALADAGHALSRVTVDRRVLNETSGAVHVRVEVDEGPVHRIGILRIFVREQQDGPVLEEDSRAVGGLYSRRSREDLEQGLLQKWHRLGYPDAVVRIHVDRESEEPDRTRRVDLTAEILRGPRVRLGVVRFEGGDPESDPALLARRTRLPGPYLDRLAVDEGRVRLARLGGFKFVQVRYDVQPGAPDTRDVVYELEAGRKLTVDVLAGVRSYELLYGGVDVRRRNLFGLGHVADLRLVQSFKATEAFLTYSIPDFARDGVTLFALVDALRREEISFRREELRTGIGARRVWEDTGHQAGLRYAYEFLRALDAPSGSGGPDGKATQPNVAAIVLDWGLDRRDSGVTPRDGFRLGARVELARPEFGGQADYVGPEIEASWHQPLGGGRFLGAGVRQRVLLDPSGDHLIPFNKRLFPGGEDSVRGFQRGEASPRNAAGALIGAESALVWNLELEQQLTTSWSVVGFLDGAASSPDLDRPPWREVLLSLGCGLRWNSLIGPIRFEYGHNLNPRALDPAGTFHFSVGFPY